MQDQIAICTIAKNEDLYINEWIQYHLQIGINHIYIYDNNDMWTDTMKSLSIIYPQVTVVPIHGYKKLADTGFQSGIYSSFYKLYTYAYEWILFIDVDEFLYVKNGTVNDLLSLPYIINSDIVHINWHYYTDNNLLYYSNEPVMKRFIEVAPDNARYAKKFPENMHCKSLVRCNRPFESIHAHTATYRGAICYHVDGKKSNADIKFEEPSWNVAEIRHYGTKTISEYIDRKCKNTSRISGRTNISPEQRLAWFFNINKHTKSKDKIANDFITKYKSGLI